MRNLSRTMIGLMLGAAIILPTIAQAQERGRDRGAMINGDARREAIQQAREANRAVERPAPVMTPRASPAPDASVRAPRAERNWDRGGGNSGGAGVVQRDPNRGAVSATERQRSWDRGTVDRNAARAGAGAGAAVGAGGERQRNWDRGNRDDRLDQGDRADRGNRDWNRDRTNRGNDRNDRNERWSSDRRDWNRDGRTWDQNNRNWDRNRDRNDRNWANRDRRDNDRWDRNWRNDRRYDWRSYRDRNGGTYRLPRYVAPRWGYSYQRWYPGYRWDAMFYGSNYWISDPWSYRLPPAYAGTRWVRYYDDAVLVDIDSGEIIDIIYSFFF